jgi:hypothetical protein
MTGASSSCIGINVGDIVVEDADIFGDGVNVAARLEGSAEPGGICVSARVQEDAAGKLDLAFEDLGEQQLKNIARPVHVYRVSAAPNTAAVTSPALVGEFIAHDSSPQFGSLNHRHPAKLNAHRSGLGAVIAAGHVCREFPPCMTFSQTEERTYQRLLGETQWGTYRVGRMPVRRSDLRRRGTRSPR